MVLKTVYTPNVAGAWVALEDYAARCKADGMNEWQISDSLVCIPALPVDVIAFVGGTVWEGGPCALMAE